jgi:hypothetical protein
MLSIDGMAAAARSLDKWRRRLREQPAGTNLRLKIERAGRINGITLILADRVPAAGKAHQKGLPERPDRLALGCAAPASLLTPFYRR